MKYKQLTINFMYAKPKRFYRVLLVKEDLNLVDLGCAIVTALNGAFEHNFLFQTEKNSFVPRVFMEDFVMDGDLLMDDHSLASLGKKFMFTYDTGDGYDFKCEVEDTDIEYNKQKDDVMLVDGAGQGIWEDNIHSLLAYLDGKINPELNESNNEYSLPWNFQNEKYSDFDTAFILEEEQDTFKDIYLFDRDEYKKHETMYFSANYDIEKDYDDAFESQEIEGTNQLLVELYKMATDFTKEFIKTEPLKDIYNRLVEKYKPKQSKEIITKEVLFLLVKSAEKRKVFEIKQIAKNISKLYF